MPRPRRPGAPEPKRRSRKGCWPCKSRKVKCGEEKPICLNCQRQGEPCDYGVRLNWSGRVKRAADSPSSSSSGYGGVVIGFADPSPTDAVSSVQIPPLRGNARGFGSFPSGEPEEGMISPIVPGGVDQFDHTTRPQADEGIASTRTGVSSLPAPASPEPLPKSPFHGSFSSVANQGAGLRSLSAFSFHTNLVAQQVSFLRNSVNNSGHKPGCFDRQSSGQHRPFGLNSHDIHGPSNAGTPERNDSSHDLPGGPAISTLILSPQGSLRSLSRSNAPSSPSQEEGTPEGPQTIPGVFIHSSRHRNFSIGPSDSDHLTNESSLAQSKWRSYLTSVTDNYGLDSGRPDLDLALNHDHAAIDICSVIDRANGHGKNDEHDLTQASHPQKDDYSGYYASPVPINIPRSLAPLTPTLLENPINLMYFHHFLNHTCRMLVPHDCDYNPFMSVLPSMAIGDPNLLNLLLAYSASHRARYLGHPEPANRIAHWVSDVFPALRVALESSHDRITDGHLATAILLLSLKIVSPGTFEVPITWESHLKLARDLFLARSEYIAYPNNRIGAFFARWLGYIDTMGALSSRHAGAPLTLYHSVLAACSGPNDHDEFQVDCFTGFTPRTGYFLVRLAQLVQQCDRQRFDECGNFYPGWHPSVDIVMEAQAVLGDIEDLSERAHANTDHHQGVEYQDMMAIEEAFRCAGLLHLHRRVLGSSVDSYPVQDALRKLIGALGRMRLGASTEVCSLFPLFTAGCESRDPAQQMQLLGRFFILEKSGMKQIQNARHLMQQCWDDTLPWIALASGQFLG